jgi:hypothetical protein
MPGIHTRIATKRGYARVTLNRGWLLCIFFDVEEKSIGSVHIQIQNTKAVYDGGWRLGVLQWLIDHFEPIVKLP